jgi:C4-dicarboxylate-specific signal transduction histidine kinase
VLARVRAIVSEPAETGGMLVSVEDTGHGLDPVIAERIFEPFFTTKPTGMGLLGLPPSSLMARPSASSCPPSRIGR